MKRNQETALHLMLLPCVAVVLIFSYLPMAGIVMAFQQFQPAKGLFGAQQWIGFGNFEYLLHLPDSMRVLKNTLIIAALKIVFGLFIPIIFALLLNEVARSWFKRSIQTVIYLPHFLSWVILGGILVDILSPSNGIVNQILQTFGIQPIFFLGDNDWFRFTLVATEIWKNFGWGTIIFLAALTGVDPGLYESAVIDGAGRWRQTWHVTLPGIRAIIVLVTVLNLGSVLDAGFDQVFNLYSPVVYETGDIIDTLVYRVGIMQSQYGLSTAIGLFKSVVSAIFISVSYYLAYRLANYRIF